MKTSDAINGLAAALAAAQGTISASHKDSTNPFYGSRYADLASVWDACRESLSREGLSVTQVVGEEEGRITVETRLMHSSGQWIEGSISMAPVRQQKDGFAPATDPQAMGSAITYARRYALAAIVGVAPEDDDGNRATGPVEEPEAEMGACPVHKVPFVHRQGTTRATGRPFDFWACPVKEGKGYCQERPREAASNAVMPPEAVPPLARPPAPARPKNAPVEAPGRPEAPPGPCPLHGTVLWVRSRDETDWLHASGKDLQGRTAWCIHSEAVRETENSTKLADM